MSFQENLRLYRQKAGYTTAKEFSEALGLPYTTYFAYENQGREPKYQLLCKIANLFDVSIDELLERPEKNMSPAQLYRLATRNRIMLEVENQERKWGDEKDLTPHQWLGLIYEELGEAAQAVNEMFLPDKYKSNKKKFTKNDAVNELYQTAALIFRFIEYMRGRS